MSFDYNPFRHTEILDVMEESGEYRVLCNSCGREISLHTKYTISDAFEVMHRHITQSHNRSEIDFKDWSIR